MWTSAWLRKLGLERRVGALAAGLFVYGFGQELWFRYLPEYLRVLGASAFAVGAFGTLKDLLDAAYAYPGGVRERPARKPRRAPPLRAPQRRGLRPLSRVVVRAGALLSASSS